ncbi:hypothetical protein L6452_16439 [Arctium lappa]|uniref:Uncharacterized protein n=1 Tax=Arctium lappa TaxID=4217 RepID=A0ACB9C0J4_ARCLA|nr:hypothetical protein L6452_16439 [Arctium lappa]
MELHLLDAGIEIDIQSFLNLKGNLVDLGYFDLFVPEIQLGIVVVVVTVVAYYLFNKKPKGCLDPEIFKEFKLVKRTQLSHNVAKFRFALPKPNAVLGLPIGQHISCRGKDSQDEEVIKPYTPTTLDADVGYFELVIKVGCPTTFERCVKAKQVVETWARQFCCSPRDQRLSFLYLANDILHNSRRKGSEFVGEFWKQIMILCKYALEMPLDKGSACILSFHELGYRRPTLGRELRIAGTLDMEIKRWAAGKEGISW